MKRALVIQHMNYDHPGRFLDWFAEDGIVPTAVRVFEGEDIPPLAGFDLMFVLGGSQDTWQEADYPYLAMEKQAIREWVWDRAKPYFGVCLGHQLLATALGGEVALGAKAEVGVFDVTLKPETGGFFDGLLFHGKIGIVGLLPGVLRSAQHEHQVKAETGGFFDGLSPQQRVMQWHHAEVKRAPQGSAVLASSADCAVQSLAIDGHALSTQFHCEFTPQTVATWRSVPEYVAALEKELGPGAYPRLVEQCMPQMPEMARATRMIWDNFKEKSGLKT
jgi:GMP synthase-like glutamine amidotransferase